MPSSFCAYCCLLYQSSTLMVHTLSMFMTHFQRAWSSLCQSVPKSSHLCWAWHLLSPACQYYRHTFAAFSGWAKAATICKSQNCIFPCVISATLAVHTHDFSAFFSSPPGDYSWICSSRIETYFLKILFSRHLVDHQILAFFKKCIYHKCCRKSYQNDQNPWLSFSKTS